MKPFIRVKKVRGNEYLYEVTPYYDSVTGKVRQKSRYLGKKDESGVPIAPSSRKHTSKVLACGEYLPFLAVARDLGFEAMLRSLIHPRDCAAIMAFATSLATRPVGLSGLQDWYTWSVASLVYPDADMRPRKILQVIQSLYDFKILDHFTIPGTGDESYSGPCGLVTGIREEETSPTLREYSPPGVHPPREYYFVISHPREGVVTGIRRLPNTVRDRMRACERLAGTGGDHIPVVFPAGCITAGHLGLLAKTDFPFVLPVPPLRIFGWNDARVIVKAVLEDQNFQVIRDEAVFIKAAPLNIGSQVIPGFIMLNSPAERVARIRHHHESMRVQEDLKGLTIFPGVNPEDVIRDIAGDLAPFVEWIPEGDGGRANIDRERLTYTIMEAGMIMVLHRGGMSRKDCLALLSSRRTFNDLLSERMEILCRMVPAPASPRMSEGLFIIAALAAAIRWRLEILLRARVRGKPGSSLDALMGTLCTITLTAGPGRRRKPGGEIGGQRAILTSLGAMPEDIIPGCMPLPEPGSNHTGPETEEKEGV